MENHIGSCGVETEENNSEGEDEGKGEDKGDNKGEIEDETKGAQVDTSEREGSTPDTKVWPVNVFTKICIVPWRQSTAIGKIRNKR